MQSIFVSAKCKTAVLVLPVWLLLSGTASSASLFFDGFDGSSLDLATWRLPTGDGTFFGRTQIKPPEYFGQDLSPVVNNGTVTLQLDTHNASDPGNGSFWGQEIQTYQTFLPGSEGISIKTRMRFLGDPPGGLVGGFFTWGFDDSTGIRDEIDIELLTNNLNHVFPPFQDRFFTNLYNNDTFGDPDQPGFVSSAGFNMTEWNDYEIRWLPDRIQWFLNGVQLRELVETVDGHPSEVRLNIWAPDPGFLAAYNGSLQPSDAAGNQQYQLEIDYVSVDTVVPVPAAAWLFGSALLGLGGIARKRIAA